MPQCSSCVITIQKSVLKAGWFFQDPIDVLGRAMMLTLQVWCHMSYQWGQPPWLAEPAQSWRCSSSLCVQGSQLLLICCNRLKIKDKRTMPFVTFKHCQEDLNINWNLITNHQQFMQSECYFCSLILLINLFRVFCTAYAFFCIHS